MTESNAPTLSRWRYGMHPHASELRVRSLGRVYLQLGEALRLEMTSDDPGQGTRSTCSTTSRRTSDRGRCGSHVRVPTSTIARRRFGTSSLHSGTSSPGRAATHRSRPVGLAGAIVVALVVVGCGGPGVSHYAAVLDEVVPAGWELAEESVGAPVVFDNCMPMVPECPSVDRYYLVPGAPVDAYLGAKEALSEAGYVLDQDSGPECDGVPGGPMCFLGGDRGDDSVHVSIYPPGSTDELEDSRPPNSAPSW